MTIKLSKMKRQNTYSATSEILLDGVCIGELETNYGYTPEDKLRVKSYDVIFRAELPCGKVFKSSIILEVDGRWEMKASRGGKFCAEYDTFQTEYKTAKEAKAAAMAYITEIVQAAAEEEAAEEAAAEKEAVEAVETPVEVQTTTSQGQSMKTITQKNRFGKKIEYVILRGSWKGNSKYGENAVDPNGKLGPKAMLFQIGDKKEWLPISQCIIDQKYSNDDDHGYTHEIKIPVWLYNKKFNQ